MPLMGMWRRDRLMGHPGGAGPVVASARPASSGLIGPAKVVPLDRPSRLPENTAMNTHTLSSIPPEAMAELQEAADRLARGVRDPEAQKKARARMDRMR